MLQRILSRVKEELPGGSVWACHTMVFLNLFHSHFCREAKRKAKTLHKMGLTEEEEMSERIGTEERKLLLAQRKLESIRILDELVERVKVMNSGPQQSS